MQDKAPSSPDSPAPFSRFLTNSVTKIWSRLPNTEAAVLWRQHFNTGDQMWGILQASHGTRFPDSWQKPLPAHVESMQRHNRRIGTSSIKTLCEESGLQGSISAESAQHRHTITSKCGPFPCPHQHPHF